MWTDITRLQYGRSGLRYASDLTDGEWELIAPHLPARTRQGRPRTTSLREVLNAILYMVHTGCQWRMLPKELPPRSTIQGLVTNLGFERTEAQHDRCLRSNPYKFAPLANRFFSAFSMFVREDQVAASVERVVYGGMDGEKSLDEADGAGELAAQVVGSHAKSGLDKLSRHSPGTASSHKAIDGRRGKGKRPIRVR